MKLDTSSQKRISPRRRFYRPAAELLGAKRQVPVLTGLPEIDGVLGNSAPVKDSHDIPITGDSDGDSSDLDAIAHDVATWTTDDATSEDSTTDVASPRSWRDWLYPIGGTLIAALLIYTAVMGLRKQQAPTVQPESSSWAWDAEPTGGPEDSADSLDLPVETMEEDELVASSHAEQQMTSAADIEGSWEESSPIDRDEDETILISPYMPDDPAPSIDAVEVPRIASRPSEPEPVVRATQRWQQPEPAPVGGDYPSTPYPDEFLPTSGADSGEVTDISSWGPANVSSQPITHALPLSTPSYPSPSPRTDGSVHSARLNGNIESFQADQR